MAAVVAVVGVGVVVVREAVLEVLEVVVVRKAVVVMVVVAVVLVVDQSKCKSNLM